MALSGIVGNWREQARLRLLLSDRIRHAPFCVRFSYRAAGSQAGALRVMAVSGKALAVLWEQRRSQEDGWHTENVGVAWGERAPESVRNFGSILPDSSHPRSIHPAFNR